MVFLSEVSRGSRSSERGAAGARRKPCCPALASLPQEEGRIQHHPPRLFQMLECTDLGNELDCVVSLFATYLRSQCLGMQSLVLRAILGLTQRPDTVSRGSRQHHECSGLGWAGPGLSWLGTFPGSGEGAAGGRRCASIPAPPALFLWGCAGQPCLPAPRCPMGRSQRDSWDRRVFSPRGQSLLYPKEGVFFTQARQTLVLLPSITEQLQGADSDTRTVALPVLSTMLRLLEGRTLSLTALELAGKLPSLFDDVRLRPHACVPVTPHCGLSLPGSQPWALRALGQTFGRPQLAHFWGPSSRCALCLLARRLCPHFVGRAGPACGGLGATGTDVPLSSSPGVKRSAGSLYSPPPRHAGLCGGQRKEEDAEGGVQEPCPAVLPPARPGRERGRGGRFAPLGRATLTASGAPEHQGCCSCWQRQSPLRHPPCGGAAGGGRVFCPGSGAISAVLQASREALLGVARFLRWRQLAHLAETVQTCKIGECLVRAVLHPGTGTGMGPGTGPPCADPAPFPLQLARRRSGAEEYLGQSLPYLQSLQEPLRREAVRFIGEPRAWGPPSLCLRAAPRGAAGGADRPCVPRARGEAPGGSAREQEPVHLRR